MRRAADLNDERARAARRSARGERRKPPKLEDIIDAFTHPLLDRSTRGSPGWKSYFALIAEINNSPEFGGVLMTRYFDPVVQRFIEAIRLALPELRRPRHLLGVSLPVRRAHADLRGDRTHRQAVGRRLQLERPRQRARAPRPLLRRGFPRGVPSGGRGPRDGRGTPGGDTGPKVAPTFQPLNPER